MAQPIISVCTLASHHRLGQAQPQAVSSPSPTKQRLSEADSNPGWRSLGNLFLGPSPAPESKCALFASVQHSLVQAAACTRSVCASYENPAASPFCPCSFLYIQPRPVLGSDSLVAQGVAFAFAELCQVCVNPFLQLSYTTSAPVSARNHPAKRQKCKTRDVGPMSHKKDNNLENGQDNPNANGWYRDSSRASTKCSDTKPPKLQSCQSVIWHHQSH